MLVSRCCYRLWICECFAAVVIWHSNSSVVAARMLVSRIATFFSSSRIPSFSFLANGLHLPLRLLSSAPGSLHKPRIRKKDRLQRDVTLLSKILRSKATWGATTAKRLKQSGVELTPFHVCEVLRLHRQPVDSAWRFFKWAQQQKRCKHGLFMYSTMLRLLGDARRFDYLWALLDDMKRDGHRVTPTIFLGVIRSYVKANQIEDSLKTFHAMDKSNFRGVQFVVGNENQWLQPERCDLQWTHCWSRWSWSGGSCLFLL